MATGSRIFLRLAEANYMEPTAAAVSFHSEKTIAAYANRHNQTLRDAIRELLNHGILPERFKRNLGLLSPEDQLRLLDLPIFIAGCGGLGGEMAAHLVQLGAGRLYLCDHDSFEESNLNRQRFCNAQTLGEYKAVATAKALAEKAPWGDFLAVKEEITPERIPECVSECAILVDCLDSVTSKKMLEAIAQKTASAWLHGAVLKHEGFACLMSHPDGVLERIYGSNCHESGAGSVLSHVVSGTASLMCALFVKWLQNPSYSSKLIHADYSIPETESFNPPQARLASPRFS